MRRSLIACFICAVVLLVVPGGRALAIGDYTVDELSTQVTVETNASVHVVERQTLTFSDRNAGVVWYLHVPESGESVRIASVRVAPVDNGGTLLGGWTRLQMIDSDPRQQGRSPGDTTAAALRMTKTQPWYSYNIGDGMMRCYFPTGKTAGKVGSNVVSTGETTGDADDDEGEGDSSVADDEDFRTYIIETDYVVAHRVRVFRDVGELYWRYAHDSLPTGAENVSLQIVLPVPPDTDPVVASESVRAWGHGPDAGTFSTGVDGTVTYSIDRVSAGNYAEAHVIFPASWLTNVVQGGANQFSELRGPSAIAEESEWVDVALRETTWDNMVRVMFLAFALIVILAGAIGVLRYGRSPRSRRSLVRVAATLGITALGASLFFREPLTTAMLAILALAVLASTLMLPMKEEPDESEEFDEVDEA